MSKSNERTSKISYCIAYVTSRGLSAYSYGQEVFNGSQESADASLEYVLRQSPEHPWKIYVIERFDDVATD